MNKLSVGQYVFTKKSCIKCKSFNMKISVKEVLGSRSFVYECIDCGDFYMDIDQINNLMYGNRK